MIVKRYKKKVFSINIEGVYDLLNDKSYIINLEINWFNYR